MKSPALSTSDTNRWTSSCIRTRPVTSNCQYQPGTASRHKGLPGSRPPPRSGCRPYGNDETSHQGEAGRSAAQSLVKGGEILRRLDIADRHPEKFFSGPAVLIDRRLMTSRNRSDSKS
jgi:hypothetical protein